MSKETTVGENMNKFPHITSRKATAKDALEQMRSHEVRHLPVIEDGEVIGIVSDRDLRQASLYQGPGELLVEDLMTRNPYKVHKSLRLSEVVQAMADYKYGSAVVCDDDGKVIGIFTTTDALKVLGQLLKDYPHILWGLERVERFLLPPNTLISVFG